MNPNPVDALLVLVVLLGAWAGWARGFLYAALDLLTLAASLAAAFFGWSHATEWLGRTAPALGVWAAPVCFVALFLLVHFVLGAVIRRIAQAAPQRVHGHGLNRLLGLLPGAANGTIHAVVVAMVVLTIPLGARINGWAHDSQLAARLASPAEWIEAQLAPVFDPAVKRSMRALTVAPESRVSIPLNARVAVPKERPELATQMLALVNAERAQQGLKPVQADPELARVAEAHGRDMFARAYFSHYTPEGKDLGDRIRQARLGYFTAGENLALAPTLASAHQGLMRSPGHRANILRPQFGRLGISVLDGGVQGLLVTQNFRN
jgi:uncharacterized protein YkwD